MNWESSGMVGFDLEPLLQGQMRIIKTNLKVLITHLILVQDTWDGKPTYKKS